MTRPIKFRLSAPDPGSHFFHVEATIHGLGEVAHFDVRLPVWTPGSYKVREYSQHLHRFEALGDDQRPRSSRKTDKATWRIDCRDTRTVMLGYDVYAHDLGVRHNHLDATHGFVTPTAMFVHPVDRLEDAIEVEIAAPDEWDVYCSLEQPVAGRAYFVAENFDELYDSPVEMGPGLEVIHVEARDVEHAFVFWGHGNWSEKRLRRDAPDIFEANAEIFGEGLPYDRYLTIVLLTEDQYGGLEHRNSTALMYPRHAFDKGKGSLDRPVSDEGYLDFLTLLAHEHFHAWHVKRIRPFALGPFDYSNENYTRDLWTIEGVTSYYQEVALLRAGIVKPKTFLQRIADRICKLEAIPGRHVRSLEEAGFDAWIRLYRQHESNLNTDVSYYLKGQIVTFLLDLLIRAETRGSKSFDDVLRLLWRHFSGPRGYEDGEFESAVAEATGVDVREFFDAYVRGTEPLDYEDCLEGLGLELLTSHADDRAQPWLGVQTHVVDGVPTVKAVSSDGPAASLVYPGDELVALNEFKITRDNLPRLLRISGVGSLARLHVFRRGELVTISVEVAEKPHDKYTIELRNNAPDEALDLLEDWLGTRQLEGSDDD